MPYQTIFRLVVFSLALLCLAGSAASQSLYLRDRECGAYLQFSFSSIDDRSARSITGAASVFGRFDIGFSENWIESAKGYYSDDRQTSFFLREYIIRSANRRFVQMSLFLEQGLGSAWSGTFGGRSTVDEDLAYLGGGFGVRIGRGVAPVFFHVSYLRRTGGEATPDANCVSFGSSVGIKLGALSRLIVGPEVDYADDVTAVSIKAGLLFGLGTRRVKSSK